MDIQNIISVRMLDRDGLVAPQVHTQGDTVDGKRSALILVHGYSNYYQDAVRSYSTFLTDLNSTKTTSQLIPPAFGFFWPGDTFLKPISSISYPIQLIPAHISARRLFDYMVNKTGPGGGPIEVNLVGHSLGCRVVLEFLKHFLESNQPTSVVIRRVALMAAAVPVAKVEDPSDLGGAPTYNYLKSLVLYSDGDHVLHWAFPVGETLAFDGLFPTAVGRFGQPWRCWTYGQAMVSEDDKKYGHGSYWPGPEAASLVNRLLGVSCPAPRLIVGRSTRNLPPANQIPARTIGAS